MSDEKKPFHNPFGALASLREGLPAGKPPTEAKAKEKKAPPKCVVRMERAGRRGKEVTVIEQLGLATAEQEKWLKALKGALGCGGVVEEDTLVLQGDQRERAKEWLLARGVKQVVIGN